MAPPHLSVQGLGGVAAPARPTANKADVSRKARLALGSKASGAAACLDGEVVGQQQHHTARPSSGKLTSGVEGSPQSAQQPQLEAPVASTPSGKVKQHTSDCKLQSASAKTHQRPLSSLTSTPRIAAARSTKGQSKAPSKSGRTKARACRNDPKSMRVGSISSSSGSTGAGGSTKAPPAPIAAPPEAQATAHPSELKPTVTHLSTIPETSAELDQLELVICKQPTSTAVEPQQAAALAQRQPLVRKSRKSAAAGQVASSSVDTSTVRASGAQGDAEQDGREMSSDEFQLGRMLGSGSYATVFAAKHLVTGRKYVVKKLDRVPPNSTSLVQNEIQMLQRAGSHPNLVRFKGWYRDTDGITCLVMGYCEGGTLGQLLKGKAGEPLPEDSHFSEELVMSWFVQLLMALHHLHARHIIHRDLKPENIFLTSNQRVIKLGDLGIAKHLEGTLELAITCTGTPYYMSPECIASRPYTYASDIWSLGCVLYEMATRRPAFEALGLPQLMFKIMRTAYQPLPTHFSRPFQQLVNTMLRADPDDRPTTQYLLLLPIIRKHLQQLLGARAPPNTRSIDFADHASAIRRLEGDRAGRHRAASAARPTSREDVGPGTQTKKLVGASTSSSGPRKSKVAMQSSESGAKVRASSASSTSADPHTSKATAGRSRPRAYKAEPALGSVQMVSKAKAVRQWDSGAHYDMKLAKQAEMRFAAREFEQRITREQVRHMRKERDPVARAKEAEMLALQQRLLDERQRRQIQVAEQSLLRAALGEEAAGAGTALAFQHLERLARTPAGQGGGDGGLGSVGSEDVLLAGERSMPFATELLDSDEFLFKGGWQDAMATLEEHPGGEEGLSAPASMPSSGNLPPSVVAQTTAQAACSNGGDAPSMPLGDEAVEDQSTAMKLGTPQHVTHMEGTSEPAADAPGTHLEEVKEQEEEGEECADSPTCSRLSCSPCQPQSAVLGSTLQEGADMASMATPSHHCAQYADEDHGTASEHTDSVLMLSTVGLPDICAEPCEQSEVPADPDTAATASESPPQTCEPGPSTFKEAELEHCGSSNSSMTDEGILLGSGLVSVLQDSTLPAQLDCQPSAGSVQHDQQDTMPVTGVAVAAAMESAGSRLGCEGGSPHEQASWPPAAATAGAHVKAADRYSRGGHECRDSGDEVQQHAGSDVEEGEDVEVYEDDDCEDDDEGSVAADSDEEDEGQSSGESDGEDYDEDDEEEGEGDSDDDSGDVEGEEESGSSSASDDNDDDDDEEEEEEEEEYEEDYCSFDDDILGVMQQVQRQQQDALGSVSSGEPSPSSADGNHHGHGHRHPDPLQSKPRPDAIPLRQSLQHLQQQLQSIWDTNDDDARRKVLGMIYQITLQDGGSVTLDQLEASHGQQQMLPQPPPSHDMLPPVAYAKDAEPSSGGNGADQEGPENQHAATVDAAPSGSVSLAASVASLPAHSNTGNDPTLASTTASAASHSTVASSLSLSTLTGPLPGTDISLQRLTGNDDNVDLQASSSRHWLDNPVFATSQCSENGFASMARSMAAGDVGSNSRSRLPPLAPTLLTPTSSHPEHEDAVPPEPYTAVASVAHALPPVQLHSLPQHIRSKVIQPGRQLSGRPRSADMQGSLLGADNAAGSGSAHGQLPHPPADGLTESIRVLPPVRVPSLQRHSSYGSSTPASPLVELHAPDGPSPRMGSPFLPQSTPSTRACTPPEALDALAAPGAPGLGLPRRFSDSHGLGKALQPLPLAPLMPGPASAEALDAVAHLAALRASSESQLGHQLALAVTGSGVSTTSLASWQHAGQVGGSSSGHGRGMCHGRSSPALTGDAADWSFGLQGRQGTDSVTSFTPTKVHRLLSPLGGRGPSPEPDTGQACTAVSGSGVSSAQQPRQPCPSSSSFLPEITLPHQIQGSGVAQGLHSGTPPRSPMSHSPRQHSPHSPSLQGLPPASPSGAAGPPGVDAAAKSKDEYTALVKQVAEMKRWRVDMAKHRAAHGARN